MKIKDIMATDVATCRLESNLADVASSMFHRDCGCEPVVGPDGRVVGMITDRDIAIALATRLRPANDIEVRDVISREVFACAPDDSPQMALTTMQTRQVRRLPVLDEGGHLKGVVSLNDIVLRAGAQGRKGASASEVLTALQGICSHGELVVAGR